MSRKIIIANWKMNPLSSKDAEKLFRGVAKQNQNARKTDIVLCPPAVYLERLKKFSRKILLGAQDSFFEEKGAFTGQISPAMLYELGARYVILGHSEKRRLGDTNEIINKKVREALAFGLKPILCVGEKERDENHGYFNTVKNDLEACLNGVSKNSLSKLLIAYEPVWALSSTPDRHDASPKDLEEMAIYIRKVLSDKFGAKTEMPRILYGGSVNKNDAEEFLVKGGVDGLLVGKASLDPANFSQVINICEALKN